MVSLQSIIGNLKTSMDQKSSQILYKTTAMLDKMKARTETLNKIKNNQFPQQNNDQNKSNTTPNKLDKPYSKSMVNTKTKMVNNCRNPRRQPKFQTQGQLFVEENNQSQDSLPPSTIPTVYRDFRFDNQT